MEEEKKGIEELADIQDKDFRVFIGGKMRKVKYSYRAWSRMEEKYGTITEALRPFKDKPMHALPEIVSFGIVPEGDEKVTKELVEEWFDDLALPQLTQILNTVRSAIQYASPQEQKGDKTSDPPPAE